MLRAGVSVSIVDVVTSRSANLYAELMARLGAADPALGAEPPGIYATTCRLVRSTVGHFKPCWRRFWRCRWWCF
jgi:hypothetical protein